MQVLKSMGALAFLWPAAKWAGPRQAVSEVGSLRRIAGVVVARLGSFAVATLLFLRRLSPACLGVREAPPAWECRLRIAAGEEKKRFISNARISRSLESLAV